MEYIYFDNAATTKPIINLDKYIDDYGNPSSLHSKGIETEEKIIEVKKYIAELLGVNYDEIYFTSGGTESNNLVLLGANNKNIVTAKNQHPSVIEPIKTLKNNIKYLNIKDGCLDLNELERNIDSTTTLVSLSHVNNETGIIEDLNEIGKIIKSKNPRTLFHVDGVQGFGKINLNLKNCKIDTYSCSAHKIHGLKGIGILVIKKGLNIKPLFFGGNQQKKIRPGTENTLSILSLKEICKSAFENINENYNYVKSLKEYFIRGLNDIPDVVINGENTSPYILNASFLNVKGEILLNVLSENNIFVSTGSACTGKRKSENLTAHNFSKDRLDSAVRFSFSKLNTIEEVKYCLEVLENEVKKLRGGM